MKITAFVVLGEDGKQAGTYIPCLDTARSFGARTIHHYSFWMGEFGFFLFAFSAEVFFDSIRFWRDGDDLDFIIRSFWIGHVVRLDLGY